MSIPFISICIPAYKRIHFLKRLLDSIEMQTFRDFEVIISDDSDDDSVKELLANYEQKMLIHYYKNSPSLGTPANWNVGISKCRGEWIKLIHDDDWFALPDSLQIFADSTQKGNKFVFSGYNNFLESSKTFVEVPFPNRVVSKIVKNTMLLLSENIIGPPSVTLFHHSIKETYDERMKWRVDLEYYIRIIQQEKKLSFIKKRLINVGVSESQVTNYCLNIPSVEIPEGHILLKKYGTKPLRHIRVFDAWWRILRNSNITNKTELCAFGQYEWPPVILNMVELQSHFSPTFLKNGYCSKLLMTYSYLLNLLQSKF